MSIVRNILVRVGADISSMQKNLGQAQKQLDKVSRNMTKIGSTLTTGVTVPIVAMGIASVKTAADFEQSMANAASVSGATAKELESMTDIARQMGRTTVFSASEAANAMYFMASAGYKADQMAKSLQPTLNLAAATQSDLAFTTDTVISTLNQFNMEAGQAGKVTNVFASAIGNSQATLGKLGTAMSYVGPVANSLGYSIESTTAALGLLFNAGFDGSKAGTVLRGALSRLLKPTKMVNDALDDMGLNYEDVNPATNDLATIIDKLKKNGMDASQALQIFGQEAGPGMMSLVSKGSDALLDMEQKITGTDAAAEMAAIQLDTFKGSLKLLTSMLQDLGITIANIVIPELRNLVQKHISPVVKKLTELDEQTQKNVVKFLAIAAAIGPVFLIIGKLLSVASALVSILKILGAVLAFLASPIGLVVAAVALLIGYLVYLWKTNEDFRNAVIDIWTNIKQFLVSLWQSIKTIGIAVFESLKTWWAEWGETITGIFKDTFEIIMIVSEFIFNKLKEYWERWGPLVTAILKYSLDGIKNAFILAWDIIKATLGYLLKTISNAIKFTLAVIKGDWSSAWQAIKDQLANRTKFISKTIDAFASYFGRVFASMNKNVLGIWDGLMSGIKHKINGIIKFVNRMIDAINNIKIDIPNWIPNWAGGGGSIDFNLSKIPMLAKGGIVTGPTLAMIGEGREDEVVSPLSKLQGLIDLESLGVKLSTEFDRLIDALTSGSRPMELYLTMDGRVLAKETAPLLNKEFYKITQSKSKGG